MEIPGPFLDFISLESKKHPNAAWPQTMEGRETRVKPAIRVR
jgi:hypothetical protein